MDLSTLKQLPRPIYGQAETLPNLALGYRHSHAWLQFSYASQGVLDVHTDSGRYLAPPQRAVWIPAGIEHRVRCTRQTQIRSLYIDPAALQQPLTETCVVQVSPLLRELVRNFSQMPVEYDQQGHEGRLVQVLLDQLQLAPQVASMLPLPADPRLQQITGQLQQHPDDTTTLAEWAVRLGVAEKTLSRLFRQQTGLTFRLWRQRLRLFSALPRLEQQQPVTDVALDCGYESVSALINAFNQQFGCTPGEFFRPGNENNQPRNNFYDDTGSVREEFLSERTSPGREEP